MLGRLESIVSKASWLLWTEFSNGEGSEIVGRHGDDVSRAIDVKIERYIYEALKSSFSGGILIAEEGGVYTWGDQRYVFVLDPLDGSLNYALGIPVFTISLAAGIYKNGDLSDLQYAVLAVPSKGEIYSVGPGIPPARNGRPVARRPEANKVVFFAVSDSVPQEALKRITSKGFKIRTLGCSSYELLLTALGYSSGFVDLRGKLRALDIVSSLLIGRALGLNYVLLGDYSLKSEGISLLAGPTELINEFKNFGGGNKGVSIASI